jgi:hypothetical protein
MLFPRHPSWGRTASPCSGRRSLLAVVLASAVASCEQPLSFEPISIDRALIMRPTSAPPLRVNQQAQVIVQLLGPNNEYLSGVTVRVTPDTASGTVSPSTALTDRFGGVDVDWTPGTRAGVQRLRIQFGNRDTIYTATIGPGPLTRLSIVNPPVTPVAAGSNLSLSIEARDAFANRVTSTAGTVSLSLASGPGGTAGTSFPTMTAGVAAVTGFQITRAGSQRVIAVLSSSALRDTAPPITVNAGPAASFSLVQQPPTTVTAGVPFATPVEGTVADAFGNPIVGDSVRLALFQNPSGRDDALNGVPNAVLSAVVGPTGRFTFPGATMRLRYTALSQPYTFAVIAGAFQVASGAVTVNPAPPVRLRLQSSPTSGFVNTAFGGYQVTVLDSIGNPSSVATTTTVTIASVPALAVTGQTSGTIGTATLNAGSRQVIGPPATPSAAGVTRLVASAPILLPDTARDTLRIRAVPTQVRVVWPNPIIRNSPLDGTAVEVLDASNQLVPVSGRATVVVGGLTIGTATIGANGQGTLDRGAVVTGTAPGSTVASISARLEGSTSALASNTNVNISAPAATHLGFQAVPSVFSPATTGTIALPSIVVVSGSAQNAAAGTAGAPPAAATTLTLALDPSSTCGGLAGPTGRSLASTASSIAFTGLSVATPGTCVLRVSGGTLTAGTVSFVAARQADRLQIDVEPPTTADSGQVLPALVVTARDGTGLITPALPSGVTTLQVATTWRAATGLSAVGLQPDTQPVLRDGTVRLTGLRYPASSNGRLTVGITGTVTGIAQDTSVLITASRARTLLRMVRVPTSTQAGAALGTTVQFEVVDSSGVRQTASSDSITLRVRFTDGSACTHFAPQRARVEPCVGGTTTVVPVNGLVTFPQAAIRRAAPVRLCAAGRTSAEGCGATTVQVAASAPVALTGGPQAIVTLNFGALMTSPVLAVDSLGNAFNGWPSLGDIVPVLQSTTTALTTNSRVPIPPSAGQCLNTSVAATLQPGVCGVGVVPSLSNLTGSALPSGDRLTFTFRPTASGAPTIAPFTLVIP